MTRYEAHIEKGWQENGIGQLLIVRRREDGSADVGFFLIDIWCLGVKDATAELDVTGESIDELLSESIPESSREMIHPACAKKLIEGAIAYAEGLGFSPHRDFRKARKVLSGIDASLCPTEFTFGRNGRPFFVSGADDSEERIDRVLAILEAHCGEDGFDFEDTVDAEEEDDPVADARTTLIEFLDAEPEDIPRFYQVSGMITALQICPQPVAPTELIAKLWGPEGREWDSPVELGEFTTALFEYWNYVAVLVAAGVAPDAGPEDQIMDIWLEDFADDQMIAVAACTIEWATGFMAATRLWPEAWGDALTRPDLAEHWEIVRWWAEFIGTGNKDRIAAAAEGKPPRNLGLSLTALARALRPVPPT
jgi:yecA family protein